MSETATNSHVLMSVPTAMLRRALSGIATVAIV
jgi:hypothetical protein